MKIGFYGHSAASLINADTPESNFIDQVKLKYSADIVNIGVPQGSEERILFYLKKTQEIDIAIIFHSMPKFVFLPFCSRDVGLKNIPEKGEYFWRERDTKPITLEEFFGMNGKLITESFGTVKDYVASLINYKKHFYHPDLNMNRYQGALVLIDSYLKSHNIKSLHFINEKWLPNWFKFTSGPFNTEFDRRWLENLNTTKPKLKNTLVPEDNEYVYSVISEWIDSIKGELAESGLMR